MNALKIADRKTEVEKHVRAAALRHQAGVYILATSIQGSLMAAAHTTREAAMAAAVEFVQGEARTQFSGSLEEQYERARRHVVGQGGQMEIIASRIFGAA